MLFDNVVTNGWRGDMVPNGSACTDADIDSNTAPAANIARIIA
jgi:hypothetical protein